MGTTTLSLRPPAGEGHSTFEAALLHFGQQSVTPLAYLILPNLPLLLLRKKLTLVPHGVINLECLLVGTLSLFIPRSLVFVLLVLEIIGSFAYEICYSFQFRLVDLLTASKSLPYLSSARVIEFVAAVVAVLVVAAVVAFGVPRSHHRMQTSLILLLTVTLVAGLDFLDGTNPYAYADVMKASHRLSIAPWLTLGVRGEFFAKVDSDSTVGNLSFMDSASAAIMGQIQRTGKRPVGARANVVLVVVESWGLFSDAGMANKLAAPYDDPQLRSAYDVSSGTAPFDGLTVPGEGRELCHSHLGFGILRAANAERDSCLPREFSALGYESSAIHGYAGKVFQREKWYRQLGFSRMWFRSELYQENLPECPGVYPGACDWAIAPWIGKRLLSETSGKPQFVYWVTLNSHIPVPEHPELPADRLCSSAPELQNSKALCSWFRIVHAVHASVVHLAIQQASQPTIFVVVGDHSPPFSQPRLREQFSQTVVPYVVLRPPRSLHSAPSQSAALPVTIAAASAGPRRDHSGR